MHVVRALGEKQPLFWILDVWILAFKDGNNHGPSYIIGLGDYTGGEVWILDEENGTVEVELPCTMRGWPQLRCDVWTIWDVCFDGGYYSLLKT